LNTIVDASIRELERLRSDTGDNRLKIIASALNFDHCRQIVEAYRARGRRADYVHSREDSTANERVMQKLENHELDVIVQVRKLGEGFDHPFLAVAAVFSIFRNLSPFVQFVGRIMRVIEHDTSGHPLNNGVVVFHAGANIASRWEDFQQYSEADREYFDQLLPMEGLDFTSADELEIDPVQSVPRRLNSLDVRSQTDIRVQEISLIQDDSEAVAALKILRDKGYTPNQVKQAYKELQPVPVTKVRKRKAKRAGLDVRVKTEAARILHERKINPEGHELDRQKLGRTNLI
jgi:superfamily II DNA or RNA helicase